MTILVQQLKAEIERLQAENQDLKSAKHTLECRFEVSEDTLSCIRGCLQAAEGDIDQLKAENAELIGVVHAYEAARDSLFVQCLSNPIKNAWGKQVDVSLLNQAHEQAGKVIDSCQRRREQAMTKEQP